MKIFQNFQNYNWWLRATCSVFSSLISHSRNAVYRVALDMHSHSVTYTVFTRTVLCIDAYLPVVHWFLAVPLTSLHISIRKKRESFVPRWSRNVAQNETEAAISSQRVLDSPTEYAITSVFILFLAFFRILLVIFLRVSSSFLGNMKNRKLGK